MSVAITSREPAGGGLFDRVSSLLELIERIPGNLSDDELEGVARVLPDDVARAVNAILLPRTREAGMAFLKMVAEAILGARRAREKGDKIVLVPFNFPPEIVYAFECARPLTSEVLSTLGVVALEGQGERYWDMAMGLGLPDHVCSGNVIELGSILGSEDFKPHAVISSAPGSCDVNSKIHEFVARYYDIPQFILEKPVDDSGRGRELYGKNLRLLISQLEEFIGEELSEEKLRKVVEGANRCTELVSELWDLRRSVPCPVPALFSIFTYGTRFTMWGSDEAVNTLRIMVDTAKKRLKEGAYPSDEEITRILWVYTSYYFDFTNLFIWMEERGYTHLGDGLILFFPRIIDTSSKESMIEGLVDTAWDMPMTRQIGGEYMSVSWTDDVVQVVKDLNADLTIYSGHHACKQTWSVVSILRSELAKRTDVPLLTLQGDSWIGRMTPMSAIQEEIDDFIKNVVVARRTGRRQVRRMRPKEDN